MKEKKLIRTLIYIITVTVSITIFASVKTSAELKSFKIDLLSIRCKASSYCESYKKKTKLIIGKTYKKDDLENELKSFMFDPSIREFHYRLYKNGQKVELDIFILFAPVVARVTINAKDKVNRKVLKSLLNIKRGMFFDETELKKSKAIIRKWYIDQGYVNIQIESKVSRMAEFVKIEYNIKHSGAVKIKKVILIVENPVVKADVQRKFFGLIGENWKKLDIKLVIDTINKKMIDDGFLLSSVEDLPGLLVKEGDNRLVTLRIKIVLGPQFAFSFSGNKRLDQDRLKLVAKKVVKNRGGQFLSEDLTSKINLEYEKNGIYNTTTSLKIIKGEDKYGIHFQHFFFSVKEGNYARVKTISFKGVSHSIESQLIDLYNENVSDLTGSGFLDEVYLETFVSKLQQHMYRTGFIRAIINQPHVYRKKDKEVIVEFEVDRGRRCYVEKILFGDNVPFELQKKITSLIINKESGPLNLISLQTDMDRVIELVKNEGFLFSVMLNGEVGEVVNYNYNYTKAKIKFDLKLGPKVKLGSVVVSGNLKSNTEVISREVDINPGDTISQREISKTRKRLISLGIFSFVEIKPIIVTKDKKRNEAVANLIIYIKEKKFGSVEIAPGYRTDIGVKLSAMVTYNNLFGKNRTVSVKAMANERLDFDSFDQRRKVEETRRLEYAFNLGYVEPYLLGYRLAGELSTSGHRKRFYSFDADIFKLTGRVRRNLSESISTSLRYQLESIKQFDATDEKDHGVFKIGSVMPSISLDLRDDSLSPRSGLFMGISYEVASPSFGAMNEDSLVVNYTRLISRNKLYIPLGKRWVTAFFASFGIEKNLANKSKVDSSGQAIYDSDGTIVTEGYIPSVKVFRLNGLDQIRGFSDSESNILFSGDDISDVAIRYKAFYSNFKVEQRYYNSESTVVGLFLDGGRVFVDHFVPFSVRMSVGVSYKYLTPVGSLNFEYGIKIKRNENAARRDSVGRFHLTIGSF